MNDGGQSSQRMQHEELDDDTKTKQTLDTSRSTKDFHCYPCSCCRMTFDQCFDTWRIQPYTPQSYTSVCLLMLFMMHLLTEEDLRQAQNTSTQPISRLEIDKARVEFAIILLLILGSCIVVQLFNLCRWLWRLREDQGVEDQSETKRWSENSLGSREHEQNRREED